MKTAFKKVRDYTPFKREIFSLVRQFYTPSRKIYQHLHFHEPFQLKVPRGRPIRILNGIQVTNGLFWEGFDYAFERFSRHLWLELARNASTVLDIGAESGIYALLAYAVNPQATIIAVEGSTDTYKTLARNSELNGYAFRPRNYAATNQNREVAFSEYYMADHRHPHAKALYKIRGITLQQLIQEEGLSGVTLMKIDVEQHEAEVLEGMGQYLEAFQPNLLIEVLSDEMAERLNPFFRGLDYHFLNIDDARGVAYERPGLEKSLGLNNLALRPGALASLKQAGFDIRDAS
jgi:FkbM family methyltransferase